MKSKKLSIGILGSRGIPNNYGGFEAFAEELSVRLSARGHEVKVYTVKEHPLKDRIWKGVERVLVNNPEVSLGTSGQFLYDLYCNLHSRKAAFDIVLHLGYNSDSVWYWLWPRKSVHLVNMDGQEWKRSKYSGPVRSFLKFAERLATRRQTWLVADSRVLEKYFRKKYKNPVYYIAYGAEIPDYFDPDVPASYNLEKNRYDLVIARMEPENQIEPIIRAKLLAKDGIPLVIFGNDNKYRQYLNKKYGTEEMIRFMEAEYRKDRINSLRHYCRYYVHGHSVGGTNPSLLEAMACSCLIIAHKNPFNEAVLGSDALYFSSEDELGGIFKHSIPEEIKIWAGHNLDKIRNEYNWESVTYAYENLFLNAIAAK